MRNPGRHSAAFTLFEVILALLILALLSGAVYSIANAALNATRSTMDEQAATRRLQSFIRVTRDTFLNLPADAQLVYRIGKSDGGSPVPELVFRETAGAFGIPSLGGGSLVLAARPRADGTRTLSILRIPGDLTDRQAADLMSRGPWVPLLPRVERVKWTFFQGGVWREEWAEGAGRPQAVRLQMEGADLGGRPVDLSFWIPPVQPAPPAAAPQETPR